MRYRSEYALPVFERLVLFLLNLSISESNKMVSKLTTISVALMALLIISSCSQTASIEEKQKIAADTSSAPSSQASISQATESPASSSQAFITSGPAETITAENLLNCPVRGSRISAVGTVVAEEGTEWTVPANNNFESGPKAADLYNECSGTTYNSIQDVDLDSIPVTEIDADGEIITGYIFADNYFELYVNGELVAVDPVPFTPFNSSIVRFKVKKPVTYAVKLIDWEENLGLGTESNRGSAYHPGDGGFVANFSDGTVTDASWRAQTFYIAPLADPESVVEMGATRDSSGIEIESLNCDESCYALHYQVPENWFSNSFDDSAWPSAVTYTNETVGVNNKPSYTNFSDVFIGADAQFIWSSNLVLDNLVLVRKTVE